MLDLLCAWRGSSMAKHSHNGRSKPGERHVRLTHFMTGTAAWLSLTPQQRAVFCEVARVYNGTNNGFLAVSVRGLAKRCSINKDTAGAALKVLEERGFIVCMTPGGFSRKTPHATEWRLTEWRCDKTHAPPTKAYQSWREPPGADLPKRKTRSPQSGHTVRKGGTVTPLRSPEIGH